MLPSIIISVIQPSKTKGYKNRLAFCPTLHFTVLELIFGIELLEYFETHNHMDIRYADTARTTFDLIKSIASYFKVPIDFSSYDQTIPSFTIATSFLMVKALMKLNKEEDRYFDFMVSYILHAPVYHADCGFIRRERGIISGSLFTNIVDSLCNSMILGMASDKLSFLDRTIVYGDDNILLSKYRYPDLSRIESFLNTLGMKITYSRESFSNNFNIEFAGSYWTRQGPERNYKRMILGCVMVKHK